MKKYWWLSLLIVCGCGGNDIQLPNQPLEGTVNGGSWTYRSANGFQSVNFPLYSIRFLSDREPGSNNPCGVPIPSLDYVELIFEPRMASASLPLISPEQVTFNYSDGTRLEVVSGILEIFSLEPNGNRMVGYLEAFLDSENSVKGTFEVRFCN